jgi:predicted permease
MPSLLDRLFLDSRYGLRSLRREPTFAITAIVTLALGVAMVTTTFSIADAELWKPLPYPHPEQLVAIASRGPGARAPIDPIAGADVLDWRAGAAALTELAGIGRSSRRVLQVAAAESMQVTEVTANYFTTLGRRAIAGRTFGAEDARQSQAAVLTDRAWRRLFASDPAVVGRQLLLDGQQIVIAGIVASDDSLGPDGDLYLPLDESSPAFLDRARPAAYGLIGRLRAGVTPDVAREQLQAVADRIAKTSADGRTGHAVSVTDLRTYFTFNNWRPLYFFLGGAVVVLLLSAVNVATLLLGRAVRRSREFALRGALGGNSRALARQLLVEGALVAVPAAALGMIATAWALRLFAAELPEDLLLHGSSIPVDRRVAFVALAVAATTTIAFALVPLFTTRRIVLASALGGGVRTGASVGEGRARLALLTVQIALTVVLLSGAGLFLRSFVALTRVPLGFDPANAVAVRVTLSGPRYATDDQLREYASALVAGSSAIPGVRDAAVASSSPLGSGPLIRIAVSGRPKPQVADAPRAIVRAVTPSYFRTLATRIVKGREFSNADVAGAPRVAIVNENLASQVFPGENPIGRAFEVLPGSRPPWTSRTGEAVIIGVASNIKEVGINEVDFADVYFPFAQVPAPGLELIARTNVPPASVVASIRQRAASIDPAIPVISTTTFDARLTGALQGDRFNLMLTISFAVVAALLAAIGIYGAVAYAMQARTREFGVRLAFGARPSSLVGAALWQSARIGLIGGAIGLLITLAIGPLLGNALYLVPGVHNGLLFGVTMSDPAMLAGAFVGVLIVALFAGAVPARRVARVDPLQALRAE